MVSRIIYDEPRIEKPKPTLEQVHDKIKRKTVKEYGKRLRGLEAEPKHILIEALDSLTLLLTKKSNPEFSTEAMHQLDWRIGGEMDRKFEELQEAGLEKGRAAALMGQLIRASIDATQEVTDVRVSVPHFGALEEARAAYRSAKELWASKEDPIVHPPSPKGRGSRR